MDANGEEKLVTFPASGESLRVEFAESKISKALIQSSTVEVVHGPRVPVKTNFDELPDLIRLPPALIVSAMTADAIWETMGPTLIFVPNTGPESVVRDAGGKIVGVKSFILYDGSDLSLETSSISIKLDGIGKMSFFLISDGVFYSKSSSTSPVSLFVTLNWTELQRSSPACVVVSAKTNSSSMLANCSGIGGSS